MHLEVSPFDTFSLLGKVLVLQALLFSFDFFFETASLCHSAACPLQTRALNSQISVYCPPTPVLGLKVWAGFTILTVLSLLNSLHSGLSLTSTIQFLFLKSLAFHFPKEVKATNKQSLVTAKSKSKSQEKASSLRNQRDSLKQTLSQDGLAITFLRQRNEKIDKNRFLLQTVPKEPLKPSPRR